jgi:hypothetical protein
MPVTHVPVSIAAATTAYTIDPDESGLTFYVPDLTASCTFTLPAPAAGLWFEFVYSGGAADAASIIVDSGSDTNYFVGGLLSLDVGGTPEVVVVYADGNSESILTVATPAGGTRFRVESTDGVTWHVSGTVVSAAAADFADQA